MTCLTIGIEEYYVKHKGTGFKIACPLCYIRERQPAFSAGLLYRAFAEV